MLERWMDATLNAALISAPATSATPSPSSHVPDVDHGAVHDDVIEPELVENHTERGLQPGPFDIED